MRACQFFGKGGLGANLPNDRRFDARGRGWRMVADNNPYSTAVHARYFFSVHTRLHEGRLSRQAEGRQGFVRVSLRWESRTIRRFNSSVVQFMMELVLGSQAVVQIKSA